MSDGGEKRGFPDDDWVERLVAQSLREDLGGGDASTRIAIDPAADGTARLVSRQPGTLAGMPLVARLFAQLDPAVGISDALPDGSVLDTGSVLARIEGPVASILTGERTVLNFLQHLSGIATLTAAYVAAVAGTRCRVLDTRKTLPGYRALAKYAVRCGGGFNHRMGLYDRVMLKDNHWAGASTDMAGLVARSRRLHPELAIEIEVDSPAQLAEVLPLGVEWILLDNFDTDQAAAAVASRDAAGVATLLEISGNVTLESIAIFAAVGVDAASVGRLTHSAPALDIGLDLEAR